MGGFVTAGYREPNCQLTHFKSTNHHNKVFLSVLVFHICIVRLRERKKTVGSRGLYFSFKLNGDWSWAKCSSDVWMKKKQKRRYTKTKEIASNFSLKSFNEAFYNFFAVLLWARWDFYCCQKILQWWRSPENANKRRSMKQHLRGSVLIALIVLRTAQKILVW